MIDKSTDLQNTTAPAITYSECCTPFILDACCGSRMFWFDKDNPDVLFIAC